MTEIVIILILILLNGLFSMIEIALVSAKKVKLEAEANRGNTDAKAALELANKPDTFLSTVQIGITLIGILTGVFSGDKIKVHVVNWLNEFSFIKPYSGTVATIIVVIIITYLTLVLGELLPKRIGLSSPEVIAKNTAKPMKWLSVITYPFIVLLSASTAFLAKLLQIQSNQNQVTEEEIKAIINEGTEQGTIEEAEQEIIERVFHLGDRNITSLMTHRSDIEWLNYNETVGNIKKGFTEMIHSFYPVCEGNIDNIKGVISIKDLIVAPNDILINTLLKEPMFVPENNTAYQVLEKFKATKIHHCFIVNEYGSIEGLITLNDILEALVGDIPQPDEDNFEIIQRADGTWLLDAQLPFYDLLQALDETDSMEDESLNEFDTVAGFILHQTQEIPKAGDTIHWKNYTFEIVDMDKHRIDKVLVTKN